MVTRRTKKTKPETRLYQEIPKPERLLQSKVYIKIAYGRLQLRKPAKFQFKKQDVEANRMWEDYQCLDLSIEENKRAIKKLAWVAGIKC